MKRKELEKSGIYTAANLPQEIEARIAFLKESGYLDFLENVGYTPLVFADGRIIFFPIAALPPGVSEGDKIEIMIRRLPNE